MSRRQKDLFSDLPDGKKYVSDIPELVAEWHPTKNEGKQTQDFRHASPAKVWWKCCHGHEWQSTIANRSKGKGCPYCAEPDAIRAHLHTGLRKTGSPVERTGD